MYVYYIEYWIFARLQNNTIESRHPITFDKVLSSNHIKMSFGILYCYIIQYYIFVRLQTKTYQWLNLLNCTYRVIVTHHCIAYNNVSQSMTIKWHTYCLKIKKTQQVRLHSHICNINTFADPNNLLSFTVNQY